MQLALGAVHPHTHLALQALHSHRAIYRMGRHMLARLQHQPHHFQRAFLEQGLGGGLVQPGAQWQHAGDLSGRKVGQGHAWLLACSR
ncbi:hypothetical protein D3C72_2396360 [compost metagenome]